MRATDAIRHPAIRQRFNELLDHTDPPASFKASEAAQLLSHNELKLLGYEKWQEAMPAMIELAFELRETDDCEILKGKKVLGDDVSAYEIDGDIRIRRKGTYRGYD